MQHQGCKVSAYPCSPLVTGDQAVIRAMNRHAIPDVLLALVTVCRCAIPLVALAGTEQCYKLHMREEAVA